MDLHATFFIATGYLNGGQMWNDRVIDAVRQAPGATLDLRDLGLDCLPLASLAQRRAAIAHVLGQLKYLPFEQRQRLAVDIAPARRRRHARRWPCDADALFNCSGCMRAGMGIGAHTVSHPILAAMSDRAARNDIANGKRELEQLLQARVTLFAYPNGKAGRDYGPAHVEIVKSLGFTAALATDWGVARPGAGLDLFQLPRFTPWDRGRLAFLWRLRQNRRQSPVHAR